MKAVSPKILEGHLHVVDSIFVVHLVEEEFLHLEKLVSLDVLNLLLAPDVSQLGDRRRKLQINKSMHPIEDAFLATVCLRFVSGLRVRLLCRHT